MSEDREEEKILRIGVSDKGTVAFAEKDVELFDRLFRIVDSNDDGVIEGALGASFLRRSRLSDETLREVWRLACGGKSRPSMTREPWFLAMKLIGMAQQNDSGKCPSEDDLVSSDNVFAGTPDFGFGIERVVEINNASRISPKDARIRVQNPSTQSSTMGIRGHTLYEIFTTTTLKHFVFKQMRVRRRFKEFEWLRERLCRRYIGLVIPKLPVKRLYGNMDPNFIEERRMELQLFLNYVLRHPVMNKSIELETFLTASRKGIQDVQLIAPNSTIIKSVTSNAWNSIKSVFGGGSRNSSSSSHSSNSHIPESKEYHRVRDAAEEMNIVSKPLRRVIAATETWIKSERSIHVASTRCGQMCVAISKDKSGTHAKCHASLAKGLIESAKHAHQLPNITAALVLTPCRFFQGLAEESCELEENRELLIQDYMDALEAKRVAQDFQASGRFNSLTPDLASKADKRSSEADRLVEISKKRLHDLAKSMLSEIKQIRSSRSSGLMRSIKRFVELQAEISSKQKVVWENVLNGLRGGGSGSNASSSSNTFKEESGNNSMTTSKKTINEEEEVPSNVDDEKEVVV